ncbi:MAG: hypothetical protein ACRDG7_13750, partial [Candidatus Limnocylindria bacterium]
VGPMLMTNYATAASASEEAIIAAQFAVLLEVVWRSIWQFLDGILIGAWWLGIGVLIRAANSAGRPDDGRRPLSVGGSRMLEPARGRE